MNVELAHGSVALHQDERTGTLLLAEPCEPIAPVRGLIDLGYKFTWSRCGCVIEHPRRGRIASHLQDGCPVVKEEDALALIEEIEAVELKKYMNVLKEGDMDAELMGWWRAHFPEVPPRIFRFRAEDASLDTSSLPWNRATRRRYLRSKKVVVHLYAGERAAEWKQLEEHGCDVIAVDVVNNKLEDVHNPVLWAFLMRLARRGAIAAIIGGPPCRTVSRLRFRRPGPRPLRESRKRAFWPGKPQRGGAAVGGP